jgi:DNA polymerase-1
MWRQSWAAGATFRSLLSGRSTRPCAGLPNVLKIAMIRLHERLQSQTLDAHMILQVHDELVLEVAKGDLEPARDLLVETMSNAVQLRVPLKVDVSVGKNWMEMKNA